MNDYWKEIFGWSSARQKMWDECRLRYYYRYIGKWEGFKGDPNREKLQWLSHKTAWFMLEGQLVHESIQSQINQWSLGREVNKDAAKSLFSYRLGEIGENPRDFVIDEVNGSPVVGEHSDECRRDGLRLLDTFFDIVWPNYSGLEYVKHEDFDTFEIGGTKVWVKIDLVTKTKKGVVVVTDWKTSKPRDRASENRNQLLGYILWAMQKFGVDESNVRAEVRYLRDPAAQGIVSATRQDLTQFGTFIVKNANSMLKVQSGADFPASPSERACKTCAYATVCPDGMQFLPEAVRTKPRYGVP